MLRAWPFRVSILDADTKIPFREHNPSVEAEDEQTFVSCHIESKSSLKFKIAIDLVSIPEQSIMYKNSFSARVIVDGQEIVQKIMGNLLGERNEACIVTGLETGPGKVAPFVFGATQFSENGVSDEEYIAGLGKIVVQIYRLTILRKLDDQSFQKRERIGTAAKAINETAKKALLTHSVKFGNETPNLKPSYYDTTLIDPLDKPWYTFTFQYRSRGNVPSFDAELDVLEAMGIVQPFVIPEQEQLPSPAASSSIDDDTEDLEVHDFSESIRRLEVELNKLKNAQSEFIKRTKIKREPSPSETVILTTDNVKRRKIVVDLTTV